MYIVYFILGAFARRWFGGMFPDEKYKILGNRGLQTVFVIALFMSIYVTNPDVGRIGLWQRWLAVGFSFSSGVEDMGVVLTSGEVIHLIFQDIMNVGIITLVIGYLASLVFLIIVTDFYMTLYI